MFDFVLLLLAFEYREPNSHSSFKLFFFFTSVSCFDYRFVWFLYDFPLSKYISLIRVKEKRETFETKEKNNRKKTPKIGISCSDFECHLEFSFASLYFYYILTILKLIHIFEHVFFVWFFAPRPFVQTHSVSFYILQTRTYQHTHLLIFYHSVFYSNNSIKNKTFLFYFQFSSFSNKEIKHKLNVSIWDAVFSFQFVLISIARKLEMKRKKKFVFRILVNK